jgi:hypothetical protein
LLSALMPGGLYSNVKHNRTRSDDAPRTPLSPEPRVAETRASQAVAGRVPGASVIKQGYLTKVRAAMCLVSFLAPV